MVPSSLQLDGTRTCCKAREPLACTFCLSAGLRWSGLQAGSGCPACSRLKRRHTPHSPLTSCCQSRTSETSQAAHIVVDMVSGLKACTGQAGEQAHGRHHGQVENIGCNFPTELHNNAGCRHKGVGGHGQGEAPHCSCGPACSLCQELASWRRRCSSQCCGRDLGHHKAWLLTETTGRAGTAVVAVSKFMAPDKALGQHITGGQASLGSTAGAARGGVYYSMAIAKHFRSFLLSRRLLHLDCYPLLPWERLGSRLQGQGHGSTRGGRPRPHLKGLPQLWQDSAWESGSQVGFSRDSRSPPALQDSGQGHGHGGCRGG